MSNRAGLLREFPARIPSRQRDELLRQPVWSVLCSGFRFAFPANIPSLTLIRPLSQRSWFAAAVVSLKIYQAPHLPGSAIVDSPRAFHPPKRDRSDVDRAGGG